MKSFPLQTPVTIGLEMNSSFRGVDPVMLDNKSWKWLNGNMLNILLYWYPSYRLLLILRLS